MIKIKNVSYIIDQSTKIESNEVLTNIFRKTDIKIIKWKKPPNLCAVKDCRQNNCCRLIKIAYLLCVL